MSDSVRCFHSRLSFRTEILDQVLNGKKLIGHGTLRMSQNGVGVHHAEEHILRTAGRVAIGIPPLGLLITERWYKPILRVWTRHNWQVQQVCYCTPIRCRTM